MTNESTAIDQIGVKSLADRREARRRRILENAENRLKKLTGVEQKSHVVIDDFRPIQYDEPSADNHHNEISTGNETLPHVPLNSINNPTPVHFSKNDDDACKVGKSEHNKLTCLLGISIISNIFLFVSTLFYHESPLNVGCNMVFLPFLGWEFLEYYNKTILPTESNVFVILLMANLKNDKLKRIFKYMQYLTSFTQDLCIYFFLFICVNVVLKMVLILR